ncbi:MAG: flagellar basal body rod protein FlgB, partial [Gammaproteobacteria bacterium]
GTAIALAITNKFCKTYMQSPIDKLFGVHAQSMTLRAARSEMLAANIANSDTPNYKAKDIDFKSAMQSLQGGQLQSSIQLAKNNSQHFSSDASGIASHAVRYRVPSHASLDGNTVDSDFEKSAFTENAIRYQVSLSILGKKISGLIRTLKGE